MQVALPLKSTSLIQAVRLSHAIMEAGITVCVPRKDIIIYEYLSQFFEVNYKVSGGRLAKVEISHSEPFTRIGAETRTLIYPASIPRKSREFWSSNRSGTSFTGFIPEFRAEAFKIWQDRASITATSGGRKGLKRYWDVDYLTEMGKAEFALCPDGGYPWSYRFFEAIMCGATPIIQTDQPYYQGYHYHKWDDVNLQHKNVEENFQLLTERLTLSPATIRKNILSTTSERKTATI